MSRKSFFSLTLFHFSFQMFGKSLMEAEAVTWMSHHSRSLSQRLGSASMVACPPPLGCMKNSPGPPIRVSPNQGAGVTMATHAAHFYQSTLSSANVVFRRTQNHCRHQFASFLQVWCSTGVQMYAHRHQQSWIVKNRWTIPFSLQPFHTDGVRPDLYCVWVREQLALSGAIPPGRTATTVLPTSKHTALASVRKPETQRRCRDWPE